MLFVMLLLQRARGHTEQRGLQGVHWGKALHIHDDCIETKHCLGCFGVKIDKNVLRFSRQTGEQSSRGEGQDWLHTAESLPE